MKKRPPDSGSTPKQRRRIFRGSLTILLFLLLGAILNVAVAWGCVMWSVLPFGPTGYDDDLAITVEFISFSPSPPIWLDGPQIVRNKKAFGLSLQAVCTEPTKIVDYTTTTILRRTWMSGWPLKSHYREWSLNNSPNPYSREKPKDYHEGVLIPDTLTKYILSSNKNDWYWPVIPLWPGFIFNTLFYAVLLWLPYQGFFTLRRHRRIRRGRCGQCGYLVAPNIGVPGASPNCPECGSPIAPGTPAPGIATP